MSFDGIQGFETLDSLQQAYPQLHQRLCTPPLPRLVGVRRLDDASIVDFSKEIGDVGHRDCYTERRKEVIRTGEREEWTELLSPIRARVSSYFGVSTADPAQPTGPSEGSSSSPSSLSPEPSSPHIESSVSGPSYVVNRLGSFLNVLAQPEAKQPTKAPAPTTQSHLTSGSGIPPATSVDPPSLASPVGGPSPFSSLFDPQEDISWLD